jgi:hypothetical protein
LIPPTIVASLECVKPSAVGSFRCHQAGSISSEPFLRVAFPGRRGSTVSRKPMLGFFTGTPSSHFPAARHPIARTFGIGT